MFCSQICCLTKEKRYADLYTYTYVYYTCKIQLRTTYSSTIMKITILISGQISNTSEYFQIINRMIFLSVQFSCIFLFMSAILPLQYSCTRNEEWNLFTGSSLGSLENSIMKRGNVVNQAIFLLFLYSRINLIFFYISEYYPTENTF